MLIMTYRHEWLRNKERKKGRRNASNKRAVNGCRIRLSSGAPRTDAQAESLKHRSSAGLKQSSTEGPLEEDEGERGGGTERKEETKEAERSECTVKD